MTYFCAVNECTPRRIEDKLQSPYLCKNRVHISLFLHFSMLYIILPNLSPLPCPILHPLWLPCFLLADYLSPSPEPSYWHFLYDSSSFLTFPLVGNHLEADFDKTCKNLVLMRCQGFTVFPFYYSCQMCPNSYLWSDHPNVRILCMADKNSYSILESRTLHIVG